MCYYVNRCDRCDFKSYDIENVIFASDSHGVRVTWWDTGVLDISWNKDRDAFFYDIIVLDCENAVIEHLMTNCTFVSVDNITKQVYLVLVRSIKKTGCCTYGNRKQVYCVPQARIQSLHRVDTGIKVAWGKIRSATGYKVYISEKETYGYRCVKTLCASECDCVVSLDGYSDDCYIYVETLYNKNNIVCSSGSAYCWNIRTGLMDFMK